MNYATAILATALVLAAPAVYAEKFEINARDMRFLPPLCHGLSDGNYSAEAQKMRRPIEMGTGWMHMQHFCHGVKSLHRAQFGLVPEGEYRHELGNAVSGTEYVIVRAERDKLAPMYVSLNYEYRCRARQELKLYGEAVKDCIAAVQTYDKSPSAYSALADAYLKMGSREDAAKALNYGLQKLPNSAMLKRRLEQL